MFTIHWRLDPSDPIIRDHVIKGRTVLPLAFWLDRCLDAVTGRFGNTHCELRQILIRKPVIFDSPISKECEFFGIAEPETGRFLVRENRDSDNSDDSLLAEGIWLNNIDERQTAPASIPGQVMDHDEFYLAAAKLGLSYGPLLRCIKQIDLSRTGWSAELLPVNDSYEPSFARTIFWDALLQSGAVLAADGQDAPWLPFRIDRLIFESDDPLLCHIDRLSGKWMPDMSNNTKERIAHIWGFREGSSLPQMELLGVHYRKIDLFPTEIAVSSPVINADAISSIINPEDIFGKLQSSNPALRRPLLVRFIEDQLLEILRWDHSMRPDLAKGFVVIGLDSLKSVDLQFRLQKALDFALPVGEGFESLSVQELADSLLEKYVLFD